MTGHATTTSAAKHRYDATIQTVKHWNQAPNKRQDVEIVTARLDYANGAMWWLVDEGTVKVGDRYTITVEAR